MTQIWENDRVIAVTPILAGPCAVAQIKTKERDGYQALQLAWGQRKAKNIKKPQAGHLKKISSSARFLKEFRVEELPTCNLGDLVKVDSFAVGDIVDVIGTSKGKGFQGVVKRHGFSGGRKTHGNKDQLRMPGSIGPKGPAHVFKGTRMAGRMGNERVTVKNLSVVKIDEENNIIYIAGAVPGAVNGFLMIKGQGELKFSQPKITDDSQVNEEKNEVSENMPENDGAKKEEGRSEEVKAEEVKAEEAKAEESKEVPAAEEKPLEEKKEESSEVKKSEDEEKTATGKNDNKE